MRVGYVSFSRWIRQRRVTNKIRWSIDNLLPPVISDSRWFNRMLAHVMFKGRPFDLDFKEKVLTMTPKELQEWFNGQIGDWEPYRETDTTEAQEAFVLNSVAGSTVLEVGCGNGKLAAQLAQRGLDVVGCDFMDNWLKRAQAEYAEPGLSLEFRVADARKLPWEDASFDTVVSTHTLEHIPDLQACICEMRRVAKRRIVIVVPCQKYKRYTIDTHVHFFPTEAVLKWSLGLPEATCRKIDGDWALVWKRVR